jgi:putative phage-type endonuclease
MYEIKVEQGTTEWLQLRLGKITGTRLKAVLSTSDLVLIDEMITEIILGKQEDVFQTDAMKRGNELEPIARNLYIEKTGNLIEVVGFCMSYDNDYIGLSPDGFTPDRTGAIEIKCPSTKKHVQYLRMDKVPADYLPQVLMYFILNEELEWLDFVSYDDRFVIRPLFIKRVTRDELESKITEAKDKIEKFIKKFEKYYKEITSVENDQ